MTSYVEYFSPDLEAILEEIARDPRAKMLKVPTSGALVFATQQPAIGVASAGLTSAEHEVLRVHREELAELLRQRCRMMFFAQPRGHVRWHRYVTSERRVELSNDSDWRARARRVLDWPLGDSNCRDASEVLDRCLSSDSRARSATVAQLATVSQRLVPSDAAAIHVALDLFVRGSPVDAERMLETVLREPTSPVIESLAWENHAWILWTQDRLGDAEPSYQNSARLGGRETPFMSLVTLAVVMDDESALNRAAAKLDERVSPDSDALADYVCRLADFLDHGDVRAALNSEQWSRRLADHCGPSSRSIIHALTS